MLCSGWNKEGQAHLRSQMYGVRSRTAWKSSMVSSTSAARAMASKCRTYCVVSRHIDRLAFGLTAFVEPPMMLTIVMAFRKDWRVRMSLRTGQ